LASVLYAAMKRMRRPLMRKQKAMMKIIFLAK
jgi:hypothetical protein